MFSAGSPKNALPPCPPAWRRRAESHRRKPGHVAVIERVLLGVLTDVGKHGLQVLKVKQEHVLVIRARGRGCSARPACVSLRFISRASSVGPISLTVVRTGCPSLPNTSQNTVGNVRYSNVGTPHCVRRLAILSLCVAGLRHPGEIALDIREEHGHAHVRKSLCQHLEGDGFARAGRPGNESHGGLPSAAAGRRGVHLFQARFCLRRACVLCSPFSFYGGTIGTSMIVFIAAGGSPLRRRPEGFAVALRTPSHAHPCFLDFIENAISGCAVTPSSHPSPLCVPK